MVILDDLPYREGGAAASKAWKLDLAMLEPKGDERRPAVVIVHGGGWNAGSKQDRVYRDMLVHWALKGYVTISVEYRLTREAPLPACIEDVKCAVRWLRAHADEYKVDSEKIGAYGHSAGAHLVMMMALAGPDAGLEGDGPYKEFSSKLTSVAAGSLPVKLNTRFAPEGKIMTWSPVGYVKGGLVPMLVIQGTADTVVKAPDTDAFIESVKAAGNTDVTYLRIDEPGAHHGVAYEQFMDRCFQAMDRFFDRTLKGK
jgi:acetyl esterase/lipase